MVKNVQIAFDIEHSKEYFQLYVPEELPKDEFPKNQKNKKFLKFKKQIVERPLGQTMLEFLNLDLFDSKQLHYFLYTYVFINYLTSIYPNIYKTLEYYMESNIETTIEKTKENIEPSEKCDLIFSEDEIKAYLQILLLKCRNDFIDSQYAFQNIVDGKYFKVLYATAQETDSDYEKLEKYKDCEDYITILNNMSPYFKDTKINYDIENFFLGNVPENANVTQYYSSNDFLCIIYITLRELSNIRKNFKIKQCENCNYYFIPKTGHNTLYCDDIFADEKTCKEYANSNSEKNYNNDSHLKKYRNRYKNLYKQAIESPKSASATLFEKYKKEGPIMKDKYYKRLITGEQLDEWVDSMRIRK